MGDFLNQCFPGAPRQWLRGAGASSQSTSWLIAGPMVYMLIIWCTSGILLDPLQFGAGSYSFHKGTFVHGWVLNCVQQWARDALFGSFATVTTNKTFLKVILLFFVCVFYLKMPNKYRKANMNILNIQPPPRKTSILICFYFIICIKTIKNSDKFYKVIYFFSPFNINYLT